MKKYQIYVKGSDKPFEFIGKYYWGTTQDLWCCYLSDDNREILFKKDQIQAILIKDIKEEINHEPE